ncbi:YraN family protein [Nocardioides sp.]|uniref:YraN family protein n=1 Tax=Nocardioides sp. TaxID=35761 RepID=UPI0026089CE5|nr:YraN family protein [Nocardioides sp.]
MVRTAAQRLGAEGEELAAALLRSKGMVVLDRNWRCSVGELDLVLRDGGDLVACEVKTRRGLRCGTPHEAITATKLERLRVLIARWAAERGLRPAGVRIDLVAVLKPPGGEATLDHVRGLL